MSLLFRSRLRRVDDVFTLRQRAREVAGGLGFEGQDQVRIATAVSEVARELVRLGVETAVEFGVKGGVLTISFTGEGVERSSQALPAAGRLMGGAELIENSSIELSKILPYRVALSRADLARLKERLESAQPPDPLDDLQAQNKELMATLEQLKQGQEELVVLNSELVSTNEGVMAMHAALQEELEVTNQGVVALYAELDDRSLQLKNASEAKTRFLRNISHELRAPVNAIIGLAGLLIDDPGLGKLQEVDLIHRSAQDLLVLVDDLLDLAKAESGRIVPSIAPMEPGELLRQLDATMRPLLRPDVKMSVETPDDIPAIESDEVLLGRVLRNLLSNAIKFTEQGTITTSLKLTDSHQHVELAVRDTGIGIAPTHQEKIFEEFFQVKGPLQVARKGTGLGLPYVRRVLEVLEGQLQLESTPGEGSTFTVRLPVRWPAAASEPLEGKMLKAKVGRVLIADDDEAFRFVLRGLLQGVALQVTEAVDGAEALAMMREEPPDLLFLDLRMPEIDGAGVIGTMMADPSLKGVPVIIVSSAALDEAAASAGLGFASAMISKSNLSGELVGEVISTVMGEEIT